MSPSRVQPDRKQDQKYWDTMAARWDDEIFNSLRHDKFRVIADELARSARGAQSVADFGCGVGVYLPLLGRLFKQVDGFERSPVCVAIARQRFAAAPNIAIHSATLATVRRQRRFDVVLCVNVAVHPAPRSRATVMRALDALLAPGGRLILVVPSLESATMVAAAEQEMLRRRAARGEGDWRAGAGPNGVVTIEGMPYKHYTRSELRSSLLDRGFSVSRIRRVEYSWKSQGVRPGPRFGDELPWDWMAVARRDQSR